MASISPWMACASSSVTLANMSRAVPKVVNCSSMTFSPCRVSEFSGR